MGGKTDLAAIMSTSPAAEELSIVTGEIVAVDGP